MNVGVSLVLAVAVLVSTSGCITSSVMETGRALEEGDRRTTASFSAGVQRNHFLAYELPAVDGRVPAATDGFPFVDRQLEWGLRSSRGLGRNIQADLGVTSPAPLGLGIEMGFKWQVPVGPEWLAVAVHARGGGNLGAYGGPEAGVGAGLAYLHGGLIASLHPVDSHAVYVSPRLRADTIYHRIWQDGIYDSATAGGTALGGAFGVEIRTGPKRSYFVEGRVIRSPDVEREDGLRVTFGIGLRDDARRMGGLPW